MTHDEYVSHDATGLADLVRTGEFTAPSFSKSAHLTRSIGS